jgi:phospho-N-acetylmuramoyl-pentapeptide-transferase
VIQWLAELFVEDFSPLNVFRYITFRAAYSTVTALLICFFFGGWAIRKLQDLQIGEQIREDGPEHHQAKSGTPTMGGLLILAAIVVPTVLWADLRNPIVLVGLASTTYMGLLGALDDILKLRRGKSGLRGRWKLLAQVAFGMALGLYVMNAPSFEGFATRTTVPFLARVTLDWGWLYIPLAALIFTGTTNAVNLADGLDGLAVGLALFCFLAFAALSYVTGNAIFSDYLRIVFVPGVGELTVFSMAVAGSCLGFLWLLLVVVGGVFVVEALSWFIQVISFRTRGKRVFRMAPIHHHFELLGWPESKVVIRFWIVGALFALLSISTLKLR